MVQISVKDHTLKGANQNYIPSTFCIQRFSLTMFFFYQQLRELWSFGFSSKLALSFFPLYSDQIWRRYHWDSPINWLHSDTRKCAKDWPYTLQGLNQLCSRHSFVYCKDHFPPATIEVLFLKQQCWIVVTYHIPWRRTSNLRGDGGSVFVLIKEGSSLLTTWANSNILL